MQRYFAIKKDKNNFILSNEDSYHIETVMRMVINQKIEVVYEKNVYLTSIINFNPVIVSIDKKIQKYFDDSIKVTICQSLVKEAKMDLIIQKSTELNAFDFIPLKAKNSIIKGNKIDFQKKVLRWQRISQAASMQSKRSFIPKVHDVISINELIKMSYDLKILCTVNEVSRSLKNVLQNSKKHATIIIVIGPEGGFTDDEEKLMISNGFVSSSLGKLVLRTETASIVSLSMINYEFER